MRIAPTALLIVQLFAGSIWMSGCRTKTSAIEAPVFTGNGSNTSLAAPPASFRCKAFILAANADTVTLAIRQVLEQGSSLIYPVASGDTLQCRASSSATKKFYVGRTMELMIEERLKLNSEKPEFVIQ